MLLHICCGPCAAGALPAWERKGVDLIGFFYNPNIHPFMEYRRRLTGAREVAASALVSLAADETYDPERWFAVVSGSDCSRCVSCIGMRMDRSAEKAKMMGCDAFSTTLTISPWQDHMAIKGQGELAAERHGVEFVYEDLRTSYSESRRLSRENGIYRQKYCGCLVSEWQRYRDKQVGLGRELKSETR